MRIRITFSKTEVMRYTSHLDLFRTWERTIRRSKLPLVYSQGFKPHPRINIGAALPLGYTSENDLMDVWLKYSIPENQVVEMLTPCLPPGLILQSIEQIDLREPTLQKNICCAVFMVKINNNIPNLDGKILKLINSESIDRVRRGKYYNLRPLIINISHQADISSKTIDIKMTLQARDSATGRPEEVISELAEDVEILSITRTKLIFKTHN